MTARMFTDTELVEADRRQERAEVDAETDAQRQAVTEADYRADLKTAHGMLQMLHHFSGSLAVEPLCALLCAVKERDAGPFTLLGMRHELKALEDRYVEDMMSELHGDRV